MYEVVIYQKSNGECKIREYLDELGKSKSKDSRVNLNKILDYVKKLRENGKALPNNILKHLSGEIWELRPIKNRILLAAYTDNKFVLLHHFIKQTQKTPTQEIDQAKRNLKDYIERRNCYGK